MEVIGYKKVWSPLGTVPTWDMETDTLRKWVQPGTEQQVGGYPKEEDPVWDSFSHIDKDILSWRRNWLEVKLEVESLPPGDFPGRTDVERGWGGHPSPFGVSFPWLGVATATLGYLEGITFSCNQAQPLIEAQDYIGCTRLLSPMTPCFSVLLSSASE